MKENIYNGCESRQDIVVKALDYAIEDNIDAATYLIKSSFDRSEINDIEIEDILSGRKKVRWIADDLISIVEMPNYYQLNRIDVLKKELDDLFQYKNRYFKVIANSSYEMFSEFTGVKVSNDIVYSIKDLSRMYSSIKGEYFIVKDEKVLFLEETNYRYKKIFDL